MFRLSIKKILFPFLALFFWNTGVFAAGTSFVHRSYPQIAHWKFEKKPNLQNLLHGVKPKTLKLIEEDYQSQSNCTWQESDFSFFNGLLIPSSLVFSGPKILDFSLYAKMSDAIEQFYYDPKINQIEIIGSKAGFRMHSWIQVDHKKWFQTDEASGIQEQESVELVFRVIHGDMKNMIVHAYAFDYKSQTLLLSQGLWPGGKKVFSGFLSTLFIPVSEAVLGFATEKFRNHIKDLHSKK